MAENSSSSGGEEKYNDDDYEDFPQQQNDAVDMTLSSQAVVVVENNGGSPATAAANSMSGDPPVAIPVSQTQHQDEQDNNIAVVSPRLVAVQHAVEYNPKPPTTTRAITNVTNTILIALAVIAVAFVLTFALLMTRRDSTTHTALDDSLRCSPTQAPTIFRDFEGIQQVVLREVGMIDDVSYERALEWIVFEDPMKLSPNATNLVQRYVLAVVYFKYGPWPGGCNPKQKQQQQDDNHHEDDDACLWTSWDDNVFLTGYYSTTPRRRWLGADHECEWAGLACWDRQNVSVIDLLKNGLKGPLPKEFKYFTHLTDIHLMYNLLSGPLPTEWQLSLTSLTSLFFFYNQLTGSLNSALSFRLLRELDLSQNRFTGTMPLEYSSLTNLEKLHLFGNLLNGTLPVEYQKLQNLEEIMLGRNKFTGTLPLLSASIQVLELNDNYFRGTLPMQLRDLTNLRRADFRFNDFTGTMPICSKLEQDLLAADCLETTTRTNNNTITMIVRPSVQCDFDCCTECCDNRDSGVCENHEL